MRDISPSMGVVKDLRIANSRYTPTQARTLFTSTPQPDNLQLYDAYKRWEQPVK